MNIRNPFASDSLRSSRRAERAGEAVGRGDFGWDTRKTRGECNVWFHPETRFNHVLKTGRIRFLQIKQKCVFLFKDILG